MVHIAVPQQLYHLLVKHLRSVVSRLSHYLTCSNLLIQSQVKDCPKITISKDTVLNFSNFYQLFSYLSVVIITWYLVIDSVFKISSYLQTQVHG